VPESCPVCDALWRLYSAATENHHTLVGKHADARGKDDRNTEEILSREISIAENSLRAVRGELRHHQRERHQDKQSK